MPNSGLGVVFDPTQSGHAVQQIVQGKQLYTTTVETTRNMIAAYNLAQRMASLPQTLYRSYSNLGRQEWIILTRPANTYGNSLPWMNAAMNGLGAPSAIQIASIPNPGKYLAIPGSVPKGNRRPPPAEPPSTCPMR